MDEDMRKQISRMPPVFWLVFYTFILLMTLPALAYVGSFILGEGEQPPDATTLDATSISVDSVTLNGSANGENISDIGFEYGTDTNYGSSTQASLNDLQGYNFNHYIGNNGSANGKLNRPADVATDSSGNIFVADEDNAHIVKFDSSGNYITQWGQAEHPGKLKTPNGVAVDADDNALVIDENAGLFKFDNNGNFLAKLVSIGLSNSRLQAPRAIAIDNNSGDIYVIDRGIQYEVKKFDSSGNFITKWGSSGSGDGQFSGASGIAVDGSGYIYVADSGNERIQKFDTSGSFITKWGTYGENDGEFYYPADVYVDSFNNVYVADESRNNIQKFDFNGNFISEVVTSYGINSVDVDGSNNIIASSGYEVEKVRKYDSSGAQLYGITNQVSDNDFTSLRDIAIDSAGNKYIVDGNIKKFDSNNNLVDVWDSVEDYSSEHLFNPQKLQVDSEDNVYVSVTGYKIEKFDSDGTYISEFGSYGNGDGQFESLGDFDINGNDYIYVMDPNLYRVQVFDSDGNFVSKQGTQGSGQGEFMFYSDSPIAIDSQNNVYILDQGNDRIQKFDLNGNFIDEFVADNYPDDEIFNSARSIAIDNNDNLIFEGGYADDYTDLHKLNSSGELVYMERIKTRNGYQSSFDFYQGDLYRANVGLNQIEVYSPAIRQDISGLTCEATYHFRTYATNSSGTTYGDDNTFTTADCSWTISPPQSINASPGATSITLDWEDVTGATEYFVQYKKSEDQSWINHIDNLYGTIFNSNTTIQNLEPDMQYDFKIRSQGIALSEWSSIVNSQTSTPSGATPITSCEELQGIMINPTTFTPGDTTADYALSNDIDCSASAGWTWDGMLPPSAEPYGFISIMDMGGGDGFTGTLDGQGHTISNLHQDFISFGGLAAGLFGGLNGAEISNLTLADSSLSSIVGGSLAGMAMGNSVINNVHIENTQLNISIASSQAVAGGLVGMAEPAVIITESSSNTSINVTYSTSGGLVAAGGIVGYGGGSISDTFATGDVSVDLTGGAGDEYVGAGGVVGILYGGTVDKSYSTGSVAITNSPTPVMLAGSLVGMVQAEVDSAITNSFAIGNVSISAGGLVSPGGILGGVMTVPDNPNEITITNNYYDQTTTGQPECLGGFINGNDNSILSTPAGITCTAINTDGNDGQYFFANQANPPLDQWDFTEIWRINGETPPTFLGDEPPEPIVPSAPSNLAVSSGSESSVGIEWDEPFDGFSEITDYVIEYKLSSEENWTILSGEVSVDTTATVTGLDFNENAYDVRVAAMNAVGQGEHSTITNLSKPLEPNNFTATTQTITSVDLDWNEPLSIGGAEIIDYRVEYKLSSTGTWTAFEDGVSSQTNATIEGLESSEVYDFRVFAINVFGQSSEAGIQNFEMPSVPSAPNDFEVEHGAYEVDLEINDETINGYIALPNLTWTAPNVGAPITNYIIEYRKVGVGSWESIEVNDAQAVNQFITLGIDEYISTDIESLTPEEQQAIADAMMIIFRDIYFGKEYEFRMAAENASGIGDYTETATLKLGITANDCNDLQFAMSMYTLPDDLDGFEFLGTDQITLPFGNVVLVQDIDCSDTTAWNDGEGWLPLGQLDQENSFRGTFDGNGHTITDIFVERPENDDELAGFVGHLNGGVIKNVNLSGGSVSGETPGSVAALVGEDSVIDNVHSDITVESTGENAQPGGGLVGATNSTGNIRIMNSSYSGQVNGIGGIVGVGYVGDQGLGTFNATSVEVDNFGNTYVAGQQKVQKFNSQGALVDYWGNIETGSQDPEYYQQDGKFDTDSNNQQIVIDSQNNIYVTDSYNSRIQKFNSNGEFLLKIGGDGPGISALNGSGDGNSQFNSYSLRIALDSSNNLYVLDGGNNRVQKFGSSGNYITQWGAEGYEDNQLSGAEDIYIDNSNSVYVYGDDVAYTNYKRVQKFTSDGTYIYTVGNASGEQQLFSYVDQSYFTKAGFDSSNNLYILDQGKVKIFDSSGQFVRSFTVQSDHQTISVLSDNTILVGAHNNSYSEDYSSALMKFSSTGDILDSVPLIRLDHASNINVLSSGVQILDSTDRNVLKVFNDSLDYVSQFDGGENYNLNNTQVINTEFNGVFDAGAGGAELPFSGGIVGMTIIDGEYLNDIPVLGIDGIGGFPYQIADAPAYIISDSTANVSLTGCFVVGGLVGVASGPPMEISNSSANLNLNCNTPISVGGGLVGATGTGVEIDGSNATVNITDEYSLDDSDEVGLSALGGLVGAQLTIENYMHITNSYTNGSINLESSQRVYNTAGGMVGFANTDEFIGDGLESDVDINVSSTQTTATAVGGIIGTTTGFLAIENQLEFGNLVALYDSEYSGDITVNDSLLNISGGIAGAFANSSLVADDVSFSGSISSLRGMSLAGGIAGAGFGGEVNINEVEVTGDIDVASIDFSPGESGPIPTEGFSMGVTGGLVGVMAAGDANVSKTLVTGDVSSPLIASGMFGASVGIDIDFDSILGLYDLSAESYNSIVQPGVINIANSYVAGNVSTKSISVQIPSSELENLQEEYGIEIDPEIENPEVSFNGIAGGLIGVGVNSSILNSYVSGNVATSQEESDIDIGDMIYTLMEGLEIPGHTSEQRDLLFSRVSTFAGDIFKGTAGGLIGIGVNTELESTDPDAYKIENTFVAGEVSASGVEGAVVGISPDYVFDYFSTTNGLFSAATKIATDINGNIYVADGGNNRIQKFDSEGDFIAKWGSTGEEQGQFKTPSGVAIDSQGYVYVTDKYNNRIQKFDSNGVFVTEWGSYGQLTEQFNNASDIAIDSNNNVYVADTDNFRIQKFDSNGVFITSWGSQGSEENEFEKPVYIAIDSSDNIYVSDMDNHRIQKFNSGGTLITMWGSQGGGNGELWYPHGLTIDSQGNVYVVDRYNNRIQKFDSGGNFLQVWESSRLFSKPQSITFNSNGDILIPEHNENYSANHRIQKFDSSGNFISRWGTRGSNNGEFDYPYGIVADSNNNSYVADSANHRIQKFDSSGTYLMQFGTWGSGEGELSNPNGIAQDSSGNIYVSEIDNRRIQKFDSNGNFLMTYGWGVDDGSNEFQICTSGCQEGSVGSGDGQFNSPRAIAIDSSDNMYVSDTNNSRIQKFDSNGNFITKWGSSGSEDGEFSLPQGIAVDLQNNVYVVDSYNNRVQKFDSNGDYITKWGDTTGQFNYPTSIGIFNDNVYVIENNNTPRVQQFDTDGNYISQFGFDSEGEGDFADTVSITTLGNDLLILGNTTQLGGTNVSNNVQKLDSNGEFISQWGRQGSASPDQEIHIAGEYSVQNSYFDEFRTSNQYCSTLANASVATVSNAQGVAVQPEFEFIQSPQISGCSSVNPDGSNPNYFINNTANAPLDQWDFDSIWKTEATTYPTFVGSSVDPEEPPEDDPPGGNGIPVDPPGVTDPNTPTNDPTTPGTTTPGSTNSSGNSSSTPTPSTAESNGDTVDPTAQPLSLVETLGEVLQPTDTDRPPSPLTKYIPWSILALLLAIAALMTYSTHKENQRRLAFEQLTKRFKASLEARAIYLQLTSHYIKTPLTKMQSSLELLAATSANSTGSSTSTTASSSTSTTTKALAVASSTLTIPIELIHSTQGIVKQLTTHASELLEEGQSLSGKQQANINILKNRRPLSVLSSPWFWLPASLI
ncbi:6-bladed beta-propeller, partial [Candidatus Saccharibacteria bacterium]|nr:6-bladed beta-propeller [Candidatus Saccharibacteria bacterium]